MDLNSEWMQKMARKMIQGQLENLPAEAREALAKTEVEVVRSPDRIVIAIDARGDKDVEKVRAVMLDSLINPISQTVELFGCKPNIRQLL